MPDSMGELLHEHGTIVICEGFYVDGSKSVPVLVEKRRSDPVVYHVYSDGWMKAGLEPEIEFAILGG